MFNNKYGLTNAVLNGYKTMTRRIVNSTNILRNLKKEGYSDYVISDFRGETINRYALKYAPFKVGEVISVAQSYSDILDEMIKQNCGIGEEQMNFHDKWYGTSGWNNKMFVKSELMPHRIEITDVRLECLQDITEYDAMCEGVLYFPINGGTYYVMNDDKYFKTPQEAFAYLIDKISGKGTWNSNPWVYVYNFKLIDKK